MGIFRFYNQNRLMFFIAIIAIIIIIFIIQILNSLVIEENAKPKNVIVDEKLYESKIDI